MKKGYGCTKSTRVFEFGSLKCLKKKKNNELTTEKVLPQLDKEKSYNRKYIMVRCLYTFIFLSNFLIQCFNFNNYVKLYK